MDKTPSTPAFAEDDFDSAELAKLEEEIEAILSESKHFLTHPLSGTSTSDFEVDWSSTGLADLRGPLNVAPPPASAAPSQRKATRRGRTTPITVRVPTALLELLREKAEKLGVPYQTLMNQMLHKALSAMP